VSIPRTSRTQYQGLPSVARSDIRPGDLLFFGDPIHHVGMYIGDGQMVEAPYSGQPVRINDIQRPDYVGAVRPGG
jgi:cell wall-associated NlpC family hydrolase